MATNTNAFFAQFNQSDGTPAAGWKIYTYSAGTNTPLTTYTNSGATITNTNPIILDSLGSCSIWITTEAKLVLTDSNDVVQKTIDNLPVASTNVYDSNGKALLTFTSTTNAVNYFNIKNAASGTGATITSTGTDTNIDFNLQATGSGKYNFYSTVSAPTEIRLYETTTNGNNYIGLTSASSLSASKTFTLPSVDGAANSIMVTDGSGVLSLQTKSTLSIASSGANSDITSMTGLTGKIEAPTAIADASGNNVLGFSYAGGTPSDYFQVGNGAANSANIQLVSSNANASGSIFAKGTGGIVIGSVGATTLPVAFAAGSFSQSHNMTLTANRSVAWPDGNVTIPSGTLVANTRTISAGGLLTGGGDLSADRTLTATAATNSDAATGTSTTVIMTPGTMHYHPSTAKAWVIFTSVTTTAITASYNVTSLTDNGTGNTTINFTSAMSNANYAYAVGCEDDNAGGGTFLTRYASDTKSTTAFQVRAISDAGTAVDTANQSVVIFGVLA